MKTPFILESDLVVYVDIDETLISWTAPEPIWELRPFVNIKNNGYTQTFYPMVKNIEQVKKHKLIGHKIVFWSAGGWAWVKKVITELDLIEYADAIMSKPRWIIDDLPASEFIPESNRIYKK